MTPEICFTWTSNAAVVGWLLLLFAPKREGWLYAIPRFAIPFAIGLAYAALILPRLGASEGGFGSIEAVRALFADDDVLAAGWAHYLAFDLFVGAWIAREADELGIHRLVQAPILLATFLLGPVGLLLFLTMRSAYRRPGAAPR